MTETAVRKGRKYDQVIEGARQIFMADGFDRASVDDIAREAGVSKATLYSYFPDKRLLFLQVAKAECLRMAEDAEGLVHEDMPVREVLDFAAQRMVRFFTSDLSVAVFRVCVSESERFPELARDFYESGPLTARARLGAYLQRAVSRGDLVIEDCDFAAEQFAQLCKTGVFMRRLFGIDDAVSPDLATRTAREAVETFMARYGA
ncbi:TetR/AcrR family transcriptional regulator [Pseudooceanicola sp. 502str34]|uniref:TetR/AcrR family transcriptional regulator n=1 Tax=Maritimibacter alkaliphilus TaxID=404236 RepID=UPI001C94B9D9|nr:TetR/AcrR family transcriptional regulator [Maritimibacter alkaliphilus]MBY6093065.1 TetR/AcrR family transcriptional regulator [Maritimibacter alkaliphilus]